MVICKLCLAFPPLILYKTSKCVQCTYISVLMPLIIDQGNFDISQDDFSGPEAELRYRSLQVHMTAEPSEAAEELPDSEAEDEIPAQVDELPPPPAANQNVSFRRRKRKQARPERAPFF
jgi:hypothetical protein